MPEPTERTGALELPGSIELIGRRVTLRTTTEADRSALIAIRSTDEVQLRWKGDDLDAEFTDDLADDETSRLTITETGGNEKPAGRVLGLVQFYEEEDPDYRHASIDIYVDPAVHRQGVATDTLQTLVTYLFDELGHHRLTIDPAADNKPAIACYGAIGFTPVGVMRSYERQLDGTWADGLLMEMLASDRSG